MSVIWSFKSICSRTKEFHNIVYVQKHYASIAAINFFKKDFNLYGELSRKNCDELQIMNAFSSISQLNLTKTNFLFLIKRFDAFKASSFESIECFDNL